MDIATLKNSLGRKFRGASIDDVQGITDFSIFREARTNMLSKIDPMETVRVMRFSVFWGVVDYAPADDLKGKKVIDPRPQDGRNGESFSQTYTKEFDRDREFGKLSVEFQDGLKLLRIEAGGRSSVLVDQTSADDEWAVAGGATGLEVDTVLRLDNSDTLRFDLGATGGYIQAGVAGAMEQVDISEDESISSFFRKIYIPDGSETITSVTLRMGSSSGAYWEITGTPHFGAWRDGVNLIRFDWASASVTGSPDSSAIDYERLTFVTTDTIANVQIGPISSKQPTPYETPYYSNNIFRTTAGAWLSEPANDTDEIVLESESENIFFYECCELIAEDLQDDGEAVKFRKKLGIDELGNLTGGGLYGDYKRDKPTETLAPHTRYMNLRRRDAGTGRKRMRE